MIAGYPRAAEFSFSTEFVGVDLLAATGCLPSRFQVTGSNRRTDAGGGSFEKRTRFTLEVLKSPCEVTVVSGTNVRRWRGIE